MDQKGHHMKMSFKYFQIQESILQTVRSEQVDEKEWDHLSNFNVPFLIYGP